MKTVRLDIRLPEALKEKVQEAACLMGLSTTEFTKKALEEKADQINEKQHLLVLVNEDRDRLLSALASPPKPIPELPKAFQWYEQIHERRRSSRKPTGREPPQDS